MSTQPNTRTTFVQAKETIESVVIALILAFVFRAFAVEAFIIPTGSMAPTLYGAHINHICTNCAFPFAVGVANNALPAEVRCPNCDWIDPVTPEIARAVDSGDRILVLKWPYALGDSFAPKHWDVVVFKAPFASYDERDGQTNYIKRLIGLPDDIIQIIDGDIYRAHANQIPRAIRDKLAHAPLPEPLSAEEKQELNNKLQIACKTDDAQNALWQVVFNADYQPTRNHTVGWRALPGRSNWKIASRIMRFDGPAVDQPQFLELPGKNFPEQPGKDFRDDYGYNEGGGKKIVSDLQLKTTATWQDGDGSLLLCLSKYDELYTVEISPRRGIGRTLRTSLLTREPPRILATWSFHAWRRNWPVQISFANVDHQLQVRFDATPVWQSGPNDFPTSAAWARTHNYETTPPVVRIGASQLQVELKHLVVSRDVYYRDDELIRTQTSSGRPAYNSPYTDQPAWASRDNPMLLRHNEYFVMGDNSPQSFDSRLWWQTGSHLAERPDSYRVGTIPADQMIGKAFFVYWPNGYRIFGYGLPIVPNVGEMRWIR